ncbi:MAG: glycosyltransferase [Bacteroidales bacterium]|nr:glycosyltransferase [Bacteroidales bacterium]
MPDKHLHIVAFDIPYPPNYGGVIDVWFKIKALYHQGIKIHLHCFEYPGRAQKDELHKYCEEVHYYPRKLGFRQAVSGKPYIVATRKNDVLIQRLKKDEHPVLFEGLHSCFYIADPDLSPRTKIFRECNIEHRYYYNLFKTSRKPYLKTYYLLESIKLRFFEKKAVKSGITAAISLADQKELQKRYPGQHIQLVQGFHANERIVSQTGCGDYILYHGNLEVPENEKAALFLLKKVFANSSYKLIIAGMNPRKRLIRAVKKCKTATLIANPDQEKMDALVANAHINLLVTFQATGLKLKLLNALHRGRFTLVNDFMVKGTHLEGLCNVANTPREITQKINDLFQKDFSEDKISERKEHLIKYYSNTRNARKLSSIIWDQDPQNNASN